MGATHGHDEHPYHPSTPKGVELGFEIHSSPRFGEMLFAQLISPRPKPGIVIPLFNLRLKPEAIK
ncbi:hypothetical protein C8N25_12138 [Algoriphagus antarcticus]|uniref:Uncharacterized protein n=1 Tax=Algoriphagus antarcticus TaxID=238540 RepID=A0A3E0DIH6_9BACT|nr:hypothetical protein C8N25_12138 [Algoriphagus antarcticus]